VWCDDVEDWEARKQLGNRAAERRALAGIGRGGASQKEGVGLNGKRVAGAIVEMGLPERNQK
jgi:hypothetical protein